jgi:hypothetical protein
MLRRRRRKRRTSGRSLITITLASPAKGAGGVKEGLVFVGAPAVI